MRRLVSLAALVVLVSCSSSSAPRSSDFMSGEAEAAIRRADSQFAANARAGNAAVLTDDFYSADAVVMPPNAPGLRGREAIAGFWSQFLAANAVDLALTPETVTQSCGDLAVENGHYDLTVTPKGGQASHDSGKYIVVWKKSNGRWWATQDIFNSNSK